MPSVVLDLFVITRDSVRYYLAIGVSSAGARAIVVRRTREWCGVELRW